MLTTALWLMAIQGTLGALDTVYYHELRARLPARGKLAGGELKLHAARDFLYALLFGALPWLAFRGAFVVVLVAALLAEIVITLADFIIEDRIRKPLGGVYPGERAMHAVMGIVYGAMLGYLVPELVRWSSEPTGLAYSPAPVPDALRWALTAMAAGVFASGVRDLCAAYEVPHSAWPWPRAR